MYFIDYHGFCMDHSAQDNCLLRLVAQTDNAVVEFFFYDRMS